MAKREVLREHTYRTRGGALIRVRFTIDEAAFDRALEHLAGQANGRGGKASAFQGAIRAEVIGREPAAESAS